MYVSALADWAKPTTDPTLIACNNPVVISDMKIKIVLGGEAISIPHTEIGLGVAFIRVWVNGNGFTSASNQIGALGYILLETQEVDIGQLDAEREALFSQLHGRSVNWKVKPTLFWKSGGIARISLSIAIQRGGDIVDRKIEFQAENCTGVSVVTNELDFTCEMLMESKTLAELESDEILSEDAIVAAVEEAPENPSA